MRNQPIDLPDLVIAISTTDSNAIDLKRKPITGLVIYAPAALTGTVTVQQSADAGSTWQARQDPPGTDITLAAAKATIIRDIAADQLRVVSGSSEAAARTFKVQAYEDMP